MHVQIKDSGIPQRVATPFFANSGPRTREAAENCDPQLLAADYADDANLSRREGGRR